MTEIELNGAPYLIPPGASLQELAVLLGVDGQAVAIAVEREVVARAEWAQRRVQAWDKVDIVRAIGGG